jgi:16S rRNA processing protein RimM
MGRAGGDWLRAGIVGKPHGLDGSFHVSSPNLQLLALGRPVTVGGHSHEISRRAGTDRQVIISLDGCSERSGAEALRGQQILVARRDAPQLGPDEWWAEDLEGCTVQAGERAVGTVRRMLTLPSCEVLEVVRTDTDGELLVPLISDAVRSVDVENRQIEIDLKFLGVQ